MSDHKIYKVSFSKEAFDDLSMIQTYTELTFGSVQKHIYEAKLKEAFDKLSKMPSIGHKNSFIPIEVMIYNVERHLILYQFSEKENTVSIINTPSKN
jgi:plasmid stabilization system protein ParE